MCAGVQNPSLLDLLQFILAGGRNMKHITATTGASVWLCGQGSGQKGLGGQEPDEPLHILLKSDDKDSSLRYWSR